MFCHKCSAQIAEDAKLCASCGAALFQAPNEGGALAQGQESKGPTVAHQAGNESNVLVKELKRRRSIALWVMFLLTACGFAAGYGMFMFGFAPIPYVLWVHRKLQIELARQGEQGSVSSKESLTTVVISRGMLAALLIVVHEPMTIGLLGIMAGIALVMAVSGKPAATRARLAKAAIYGVAAIAVYMLSNNNHSQGDMLAGKLEEYKRQHGAYPERLDNMVPALLSEIPKSGLIGFQYTRQDGSYVLMYRPSAAGSCSYTPVRESWKCQAR